MAKKDSAVIDIEAELLDATGVDGQKEKGEKRQDYLIRLLSAVQEIPEKKWAKLSEEAQAWVGDATDAFNDNKAVADFPGAAKSGKAKDEEDDDAGDDDADTDVDDDSDDDEAGEDDEDSDADEDDDAGEDEDDDEAGEDDDTDAEAEDEKPKPTARKPLVKPGAVKPESKPGKVKEPAKEPAAEAGPKPSEVFRRMVCKNIAKKWTLDDAKAALEKKGIEVSEPVLKMVWYETTKTIAMLKSLEMLA